MSLAKMIRRILSAEFLTLLIATLTPALASPLLATTHVPGAPASPREMITLANDVLVYSNERIGNPAELERRIGALSGSAEYPGSDVHAAFKITLADLMQSAARGQDLPWETPRDFSRITRDIVSNIEYKQADTQLLLEFIALQYLAKSYLGIYELAPEQERSVISKNELQLIEVIEQRLALSVGSKQKSTLAYVKKAIADSLYEQLRFSPKATPLVVYRGTRSLSKGLDSQ